MWPTICKLRETTEPQEIPVSPYWSAWQTLASSAVVYYWAEPTSGCIKCTCHQLQYPTWDSQCLSSPDCCNNPDHFPCKGGHQHSHKHWSWSLTPSVWRSGPRTTKGPRTRPGPDHLRTGLQSWSYPILKGISPGPLLFWGAWGLV